jgi:hypothetical protein
MLPHFITGARDNRSGARIVKAFNHLDAQVLPQPEAANGQRVLLSVLSYCCRKSSRTSPPSESSRSIAEARPIHK